MNSSIKSSKIYNTAYLNELNKKCSGLERESARVIIKIEVAKAYGVIYDANVEVGYHAESDTWIGVKNNKRVRTAKTQANRIIMDFLDINSIDALDLSVSEPLDKKAHKRQRVKFKKGADDTLLNKGRFIVSDNLSYSATAMNSVDILSYEEARQKLAVDPNDLSCLMSVNLLEELHNMPLTNIVSNDQSEFAAVQLPIQMADIDKEDYDLLKEDYTANPTDTDTLALLHDLEQKHNLPLTLVVLDNSKELSREYDVSVKDAKLSAPTVIINVYKDLISKYIKYPSDEKTLMLINSLAKKLHISTPMLPALQRIYQHLANLLKSNPNDLKTLKIVNLIEQRHGRGLTNVGLTKVNSSESQQSILSSDLIRELYDVLIEGYAYDSSNRYLIEVMNVLEQDLGKSLTCASIPMSRAVHNVYKNALTRLELKPDDITVLDFIHSIEKTHNLPLTGALRFRSRSTFEENPVPLSVKGKTIKNFFKEHLEMVVIPGGSFLMGKQFTHRVNIECFELGKYPVTQKLWVAVMNENRSHFQTEDPECPVENVSWGEAQDFIDKLNRLTGEAYRLPSEAEWEYAAEKGSNINWGFADDESNIGEYSWYRSNSGLKTQRVGQKLPNAFGIYDMQGNVWEWTRDCWHDNFNGAPTDGSAWITKCSTGGHVLKGGSWKVFPSLLQPGVRLRSIQNDRENQGAIGFRLAKSIAPLRLTCCR